MQSFSAQIRQNSPPSRPDIQAERGRFVSGPSPDTVEGSGASLLYLPYADQARAFLAVSVSWVKAALSLTASSASIFRLMTTPAFFSPFMKLE